MSDKKNDRSKILFLQLAILTVVITMVLIVYQSKTSETIDYEKVESGAIITKDNLIEFYTELEHRQEASNYIGKPMPEFSLITATAGEMELQDGNYLLMFGNTACAPCNQSIEPLYEFGSDKDDINVYSIFLDKQTEELSSYKEQHELNTNTLYGIDSFHAEYDEFDFSITPTTFFVDGDGIVRFVNFGTLDNELLEYLYNLIY